jgi:hypothetical protein
MYEPMLQLNNNTPFAANIAPLTNQDGIDTLYVLAKATFSIGPQWTLADKQPEPQKEDVYWAEPTNSSLKIASDLHLGKSTTDIIVNGQALTPGQQPRKQLDVSLAIGSVQQNIRVFGNRYWRNSGISSPEPFTTMPLIYERAFGGRQEEAGITQSTEERNPVGMGYFGEKEGNIEGRPLPNLEDPETLIQSPENRPEPSCCGFVAPHWRPRVDFAGTYDQNWAQQRAPYLPEDFDRRFFTMSHRKLTYPEYLQGGEPVRITNMHPKGELNFNLPRVNLDAQIKRGTCSERIKFDIETVIIEPNTLQLSLVWKAAYPCDKTLLKINEIKVSLIR